jgi:hypothetical protein
LYLETLCCPAFIYQSVPIQTRVVLLQEEKAQALVPSPSPVINGLVKKPELIIKAGAVDESSGWADQARFAFALASHEHDRLNAAFDCPQLVEQTVESGWTLGKRLASRVYEIDTQKNGNFTQTLYTFFKQ